ncbi:hypothetical protein F5Y00DRAFT_225196 [Daldinia vernicosa]|uniref:uncharacterized protein n=1 Tax=Daldinia vernicosa TaxID=114800 RepID=UPI0020085C76|nr:uncharacterized protein F5Y00DRAFT_225196 [Daldinia vernicosa]KAI0853034.1 hypothetical protein F5Y00DRAFT_225196 [Daldinia vernicosa]
MALILCLFPLFLSLPLFKTSLLHITRMVTDTLQCLMAETVSSFHPAPYPWAWKELLSAMVLGLSQIHQLVF